MMRVASIRALPFHRWVLEPTERALLGMWADTDRAQVVEVCAFDHVPSHHHDWLTTGDRGRALLAEVRAWKPDAALLADYPYDDVRVALGGVPVVATRHSLAARGNTYEPEQAQADLLAAWGPVDQALLDERVWPRMCERGGKIVYCGCPWLYPSALLPLYETRPVLWAPSWNVALSRREEVEAALRMLNVPVRVRPHAATAWREPALLDRWRGYGWEIGNATRHPMVDLGWAGVLLTDVSGIALMAMATTDDDGHLGSLPVVQIDANPGPLHQFQAWGPEWTCRGRVGERIAPGTSPEAIADGIMAAVVSSGAGRSHRRQVAVDLLGSDDPFHLAGAPARFAAAIVAAFGGAR